MAIALTGPVTPAEAKSTPRTKTSTSNFGAVIRSALGSSSTTTTAAAVAAAPKKYTVEAGDTVSSIAAKFGLSTASVLALNGLSWKTIIHPGQVLQLTKNASKTPTPSTTTTSKYTIVSGDTISKIAKKFGVTTNAVLKANGLSWSSIIYAGQKLTIPAAAKPPVDAPTPPTDAPTDVSTATTHVIKSGETISTIAKKYGVSVQSLLTANGLVLSSIIYAGQSLTIPGQASTPVGTGSTITLLTAPQEANAKTIISVGRSLGVSDYGIVIALAAAMQESSLRNINYGHLDSVGLFQQRPSSGWGTSEQLTNTTYATQLFFGGPANPNKGKTRGLLDISGWQNMTVTQAAQKVQISGHPDAYAQWEASAKFWLSELG